MDEIEFILRIAVSIGLGWIILESSNHIWLSLIFIVAWLLILFIKNEDYPDDMAIWARKQSDLDFQPTLWRQHFYF